MLALINTLNYEFAANDMQQIVEESLPEKEAELVWDLLDDLIAGGSSEECLYREMYKLIKEYKNV
jgi:hypothetical protein